VSIVEGVAWIWLAEMAGGVVAFVVLFLFLRSWISASEPQFQPEPRIHPYAKEQINRVTEEIIAAEFMHRYTMFARGIGCRIEGDAILCDKQQSDLLTKWWEANTRNDINVADSELR
jgi:hypothetical protein